MSEILLSDIVGDTLPGEGIFDKLMTAIDIRLSAQYDKQRISGADYASVYLGAMQTALQQSIAFALGKEQADKQADLVANQGIEVLAGTVRNDALSASTISKDNADITLSGNQNLEVIASTLRNDELSTSTISKNTNDTLRNDSIATSQISKATSEKALLDQKTFTEQAQTLDTVNGLSVAGLVGKQKELYTNQSDGFLRQAEQRAIKAFTDIWTIAKSTDPDSVPLPFNADQSSMDVMLEKLAEGIGVSKTDLNVTSKIIGATLADPAVITVNKHGLTTGDSIRITEAGGMIELNNIDYVITVTGASTFILDNIDSTGFTTYTSGGIITRL